MEKLYLNRDEYEAAVDEYRKRSGYDDMSDEEKDRFDEKLDQAVGIRESEDTEPAEPSDRGSDSMQLRDEMREKYGYDNMSDAEKANFDEKLDQVFGSEGESGEDAEDAPEKVLTRRR